MPKPLPIPRVLLLIETSRNYGRQLVEGIGRYAREHGPWFFHFQERSLEELAVRGLRRAGLDGIIARLQDPATARRLRRSGLPFVELYGTPGTAEAQVTVDEQALARMAAEHLLSLGLKHLAFFSTVRAWYATARRQAFVRHLAALGFACAWFEPRPTPPGPAASALERARQIRRWVQALPKPAGILCATDHEALSLLEACHQAHIAVPDQVAVLGVDNDAPLCAVAWPRLSSIDLDAQRIGYEAAAILARLLEGRRAPPRPTLLAPKEVIARESSDVLATADPQVVRAVRLIRQFACKGIAVQWVADQIVMCRRTLERRFKAAMGRTLKAEILRVKIDRARHLLAENRYPLKRVGELSGFHSIHDFTRAFRRHTGEPPARYTARLHLPPRA